MRVNKFVDRSKQKLNNFPEANVKSCQQFLTPDQLESISELQTNVKLVGPPLHRMEYALEHKSSFPGLTNKVNGLSRS